MSYLVNLEKFYGPLDLLLYLIEKDQMDIYDIPVALIADQYMDFIRASGQIDLDHVGDFLIMASYLLNLKSRMLLPDLAKGEETDTDASDPREELVYRLLEYKKYKLAAELLASRFNDDLNRIYFRSGQGELEWVDREISSSLNSLLRAWYGVMQKKTLKPEYNVPQSDINVGDMMDAILRALPLGGETLIFQDVYANVSTRREVLAYFLALLELIRLQKVEAIQEKKFGEIQLFIRVAIDNVNEG
ncbi:MAG: segregation/condensation protein A [Syntrophomonas sp.]|nr:segregation/condensation protein A [Syntrophomonas sp.]